MDISSLFLPPNLLNHFTAIKVLELCDIKTKEDIIELHLEEKNVLQDGYWNSYSRNDTKTYYK